MISAFGSDPGFKHTMGVCVGVGTCAVICVMSIVMVVRGVRRLGESSGNMMHER